MRGLVSVLDVSFLIFSLLQSSMYEAVFRVHNGCLAVLLAFFLYPNRFFVA